MITLVLGGARSGKSTYAERLTGRLPAPITYVATLLVGDDQDLSARVARHRQRRPAEWGTVEAGLDLPAVVRSLEGSMLLDSLGPWVALNGEAGGAQSATLCRALTERSGDSVVVSEEVGLGVHPSSAAGRHFRDALGTINQDVAEVADRVLLIVAGRALPLHRAP